MTICLAGICENENAVVVASDRMITASYLALEFEHPNPKFEALTEHCVGLTAGDALARTELFRACRDSVNQLKSPHIELVANTVKEQFVELRRKRAEEEVLQPRGFTFNQFYKEGFIGRIPPDLAMMLDASIQNSRYPLSILIAGVDQFGAHIYGIEDPGIVNCFDGLGYAAIGSGDRHALYSIVDNNHNSKLCLNDTVFLVFEAKKRAEHAPGVGEAVAMAIITRDGIEAVPEETLQQLESIHLNSIEPRQKVVEEAIAGLRFGKKELEK